MEREAKWRRVGADFLHIKYQWRWILIIIILTFFELSLSSLFPPFLTTSDSISLHYIPTSKVGRWFHFSSGGPLGLFVCRRPAPSWSTFSPPLHFQWPGLWSFVCLLTIAIPYQPAIRVVRSVTKSGRQPNYNLLSERDREGQRGLSCSVLHSTFVVNFHPKFNPSFDYLFIYYEPSIVCKFAAILW